MNLIEVIPSCVPNMVKAGLISTIAGVLQESIGYQEIADVSAKILSRVAMDMPVEVMISPAI